MIYRDYMQKRESDEFEKKRDCGVYCSKLRAWIDDTSETLQGIFPTALEENFFNQMLSVQTMHYNKIDNDVGALVYHRIPQYVDRLQQVLDVHLGRYSDLPL